MCIVSSLAITLMGARVDVLAAADWLDGDGKLVAIGKPSTKTAEQYVNTRQYWLNIRNNPISRSQHKRTSFGRSRPHASQAWHRSLF
jgi:hypothetical protein